MKKNVLIMLLCGFSLMDINCNKASSTIYNAIYFDVNANNKEIAFKTRINRNIQGNPPNLYIVESERLYLLVEYSWNRHLWTEVRHIEWDYNKLDRLLMDKNFRYFFPDPNKKGGGIKWIVWPGE